MQLLKSYLRPHGRFILIEYNIEQGNSAVPYPVSYRMWEELAAALRLHAHTVIDDAAQPLLERNLFSSQLVRLIGED